MKSILVRLSAALLFTLSLLPQTAAGGESPWPFFAFDNGVGRGVWPAKVQAQTVKELGYDGIHYNYTNPADFRQKIDACEAAGVPIHAVYIYTFVNPPKGASYDPGIKEVIRMLKGSDTMIWLTLRDGKKGQEDNHAVATVREIADLAAASGLKVSLYPHAGFYVATAEEAVRVVKQVDRANVGVTVNLCHELFAGNGDRLDEVVKAAAPYLNLVSINGASPIPGKGPRAWETHPLGSGSFDVEGFLRLIRQSGYRGPIGHQFYGVTGDDKVKLTRAIRAWLDLKPRALASL
ncbi:MAG: sugar phosphate isomerase/epimerase [Akkermansiaceae bacterium]|jgi:sugar phosphate isomerase/epimerase|nr:sugar phosphate isomerase/epimerase [Akkermansiaceae bacterium]